ncbi:MAG: hypothetical protein KC912_14910 [Proteobacteria bacterium]|nr:hypothetical protein [Pseudomonadota bacterium]
MFRVIPDIIANLRAALPPWAFALVLLAAVALIAPSYFYWLRSKQIKGKFRAYGRAIGHEQRDAVADEMFALAGGRARLVVTIADEAERLGMKALLDRAMGELANSGAAKADVKRLRDKTEREKPPPMHPLEEAVHVERMLDEGLLPGARQRLERALERFPEDAELVDLAERLAIAEQEVEDPG